MTTPADEHTDDALPAPAPREPFLGDAHKEEFLAMMRADHGEQWVRDNWERLEAEWEYIQSW
jgi:hypothetical protein